MGRTGLQQGVNYYHYSSMTVGRSGIVLPMLMDHQCDDGSGGCELPLVSSRGITGGERLAGSDWNSVTNVHSSSPSHGRNSMAESRFGLMGV